MHLALCLHYYYIPFFSLNYVKKFFYNTIHHNGYTFNSFSGFFIFKLLKLETDRCNYPISAV